MPNKAKAKKRFKTLEKKILLDADSMKHITGGTVRSPGESGSNKDTTVTRVTTITSGRGRPGGPGSYG